MKKISINAEKITENVIGTVVGLSTYAVTRAVIQNNVSEPETRAQKATLAVGSYAIGHTVAAKTRQWSNAKVRSLIDAWNEGVEKTESSTTETTQS